MAAAAPLQEFNLSYLPNFSINQIESFLILANTLNYTRAAEILHITQPNLSRIIVNMEEEIGVKLFIRDKRYVKLTHAGEYLKDSLPSVMQQMKDILLNINQFQHAAEGTLKIGAVITATSFILPKAVQKFHTVFPDVQLMLLDFNISEIYSALYDKDIDIVFLPSFGQDTEIENLDYIELFQDDMCLAINEEVFSSEKEYISIDDYNIKNLGVIDEKCSPIDYHIVHDILKVKKIQPLRRTVTNSLHSLLLMVESASAATYFAEHVSLLTTEKIKFFKIKEFQNYFKIVCVNKRKNQLTDSFIEYISEVAHDWKKNRNLE